jgi:hypothetical protein
MRMSTSGASFSLYCWHMSRNASLHDVLEMHLHLASSHLTQSLDPSF